jgi:hypothetical protein
MRFAKQRGQDGSETETSPGGRSASTAASARLQLIDAFFVSNEGLLHEMRERTEQELSPIGELLLRQHQTMLRLLANLDEQLGPLQEYATNEEENLGALEARIDGGEGNSDFLSRAFSSYLSDQRRRLDETRHQIEEQRAPFLAYADDQRDAVESALARFDSDIDALEHNLAEQRQLLMRMLDAMGSDTFAQTREYLAEREATLSRLAIEGAVNPAEIVAAVSALRASMQPAAGRSNHVRAVLESTDEADRRMAESVTQHQPEPLFGGYDSADGWPTAEPQRGADEASAQSA